MKDDSCNGVILKSVEIQYLLLPKHRPSTVSFRKRLLSPLDKVVSGCTVTRLPEFFTSGFSSVIYTLNDYAIVATRQIFLYNYFIIKVSLKLHIFSFFTIITVFCASENIL